MDFLPLPSLAALLVSLRLNFVLGKMDIIIFVKVKSSRRTQTKRLLLGSRLSCLLTIFFSPRYLFVVNEGSPN